MDRDETVTEKSARRQREAVAAALIMRLTLEPTPPTELAPVMDKSA